ncbi:MAG: hypothetical protein ABR573_03035 [Candidatus Dormibacteria bacterium]
MRSRLISLPLYVVIVLFVGGCGIPGGGLALSVERKLSDIVFGEPTAPKVHAPARPQGPAAPVDAGVQLPPIFVGGDVISSNPYTFRKRKAPPSVCPTAPPGTAAELPAGADSDKAPKEGKYQWLTGYVARDSKGVPLNAFSDFETRTIQNVKTFPDQQATFASQTIHHWTFDMVQPDHAPDNPGGTITTSFSTKTWSDLNQNSAFYNNNIDPQDGVAITQIVRNDVRGGQVDIFQPTATYETNAAYNTSNPTNPSPPGSGGGYLLLFTLPVASGSYSWDFNAVDQTHQWTMEVNAQTTGRRTLVDACGEVIDGWPVTATVTTNKGTRTGMVQQWSYVFATQYGAIPIVYQISGDTTFGSVNTQEKLAHVAVAPLQ